MMTILPAVLLALSIFTIDDEMKLRTIVDVKISPDGERVGYVVSTPKLEKNEHQAALYVIPARGGTPQRIAETLRIFNTPLPAPRLRWSPDSQSLAVLAFAGERPQVFAIPLSGGEPRSLTDATEGVHGFEFSPDGKSIAYLTRDSMPAEEKQRRSMVVRVDAPEPPTRLMVQKLEEKSSRALTPTSHYVNSFSWSPDGRELVYSAAPRSGFSAQYETRLYAVPIEGGSSRVIVDRTGMNTRPQYSPDGRLIAFISTTGQVNIMAPRSLAVVPSRGGESRTFRMDDAWVNEFVWARDSRSIYLQANDGSFASRERMFEQPIVQLRLEDGRAESVIAGGTVNYALSLSADGRRLAYRSVQARDMGDVFVLDLSRDRRRPAGSRPEAGGPLKLTEVNPELSELALGELRSVRWRSFDGMDIWGLLLTPPGWTAGNRVPLLVYVHGGPGGGVTYGLFPQFMHVVGQVDPYPVEAMAGAGFAVLFPMPRGGAGYGEAGQRAIINAWGEADYRDIMTGVDAMISRGIADPERLGVMGASYGGYMTNWIITQTDRFKAASAGASISDLEDLYLLPDGGEILADYFKRPWENRESYVAHSPLTWVERVTTPLLIQHGERDPRVPVAGAWKMYRALKTLGKTVEFDLYPRGGHVMYEPILQREVMRRNLDWFTRWIETATPKPAAENQLVTGVVSQFGTKLKLVSVLAPKEDAARSIRQHYGPLVASELLEQWTENPASAPGRLVSSPWPDRIEVSSITPVGPDRYSVEGEIIERTSADDASHKKPVRLVVELTPEGWRITDLSSRDESDLGPEGAIAVMEAYYAAISAGDYKRAYEYWAPGANRQNFDEFRRGFTGTASVQVKVGTPGRIDPAAGSRYIEVPVEITARSKDGKVQRFGGSYVLRRGVIEGVTPEQRLWRIASAQLETLSS